MTFNNPSTVKDYMIIPASHLLPDFVKTARMIKVHVSNKINIGKYVKCA